MVMADPNDGAIELELEPGPKGEDIVPGSTPWRGRARTLLSTMCGLPDDLRAPEVGTRPVVTRVVVNRGP
jgi:hypothetical protein